MIHESKGEKEKAIHHLNTALGIASPPGWHEELFWIHYSLADLFCDEDEFDDANAHIEQAKPHAVNNNYKLGRAIQVQARVWSRQSRLEDAKLEALRALEIYEKFGATRDTEICTDLLRTIEEAMQIQESNLMVPRRPTGFQR